MGELTRLGATAAFTRCILQVGDGDGEAVMGQAVGEGGGSGKGRWVKRIGEHGYR